MHDEPFTDLVPPPPEPARPLWWRMLRSAAPVIFAGLFELARGITLVVLYLPARFSLVVCTVGALMELQLLGWNQTHGHPVKATLWFVALIFTGIAAVQLPKFYVWLRDERIRI